jgi:DEAD/DEAH box helicase domain-containing protein
VIPSVLAAQVRRGIEDFLLTTFPITNPYFAGCLDRLLTQPGEVFRGPYLSLKLPFTPASGTERYFPQIVSEGFRPYRHQELAWERLDSRNGRSTLVATGTGSGKTECFLYPILDHCYRHRGKPGIKAILIYPMNALATDQAGRLAKAIYQNPELREHVRAGLYLGEDDGPRRPRSPAMTATELIAERGVMQNKPPDILLTNYKMLDYLLVRAKDAGLWKNNAPDTLQYLVVDELHSFDGAQGADLACLIRRVKERVRTPVGRLICIGTSATLGDTQGSDSAGTAGDLIRYASRVFAEEFDEQGLVGESVLTTDQFLAGQLVRFFGAPSCDKKELDPLTYDDMPAYVAAQHRLWFGRPIGAWEDPAWRIELGRMLRMHGFFRNLLTILGGRSKSMGALLDEIEKLIPISGDPDREYMELLLCGFLTLISQARVEPSAAGQPPQPLVSLRNQLWLRELRRMVSLVESPPELKFADDLKTEQLKRSLPVIHCRECGITGWGGVVKDADSRIVPDLMNFYEQFFSNSQHVRFLFPGVDLGGSLPQYLCRNCLNLYHSNEPDECGTCGAAEEDQIRVWVPETNEQRGENRRLFGKHDCEACGGMDSLTILGSRAASLTSVLIAQVFGSTFNRDKRMLAFSDNVQDASHRAGFFGARTYTFNLRAALQQCLPEAPVPFADAMAVFRAKWEADWTQAKFLSTFLAPDMEWLTDYEYLRKNGEAPAGSNLADLVRRRVDWEIWSEYTLDARIGRTLEKAGCSTIEPVAGLMEEIVARLLPVLQNEIGDLRELDSGILSQFLDGLILRLKNRGGMNHPDLGRYIESLGNWFLLSNKAGGLHRPAAGHSSRAPMFLTDAHSGSFPRLTRARAGVRPTWCETWLAKNLIPVCPNAGRQAADIYSHTMRAMVDGGLLFEKFAGHARVWGLRPEAFQITKDMDQLRCDVCSNALSAGRTQAARLAGSACPLDGCAGAMRVVPPRQDYYRRMYQSGDVERVFTAEHTGLLSRSAREEVEQGFMRHERPSDPNLLSCTPTLEMGINIGDLSSLAMCSVPPKPSNYLQRAGRAGRVDGNAFVLTVANGRPHDLFFFFEPEEMIQGHVESPGCFLDASAVLERQFTAYCFDRWVETGDSAIPQKLQTVMDAIDKGEAKGETAARNAFPWNFLRYFESHRTGLEEGFLAMFAGAIESYTVEKVLEFSRGEGEQKHGLQAGLLDGFRQTGEELKGLRRRIRTLGDRVREMESNPARPQDYEEELQNLKQERGGLMRLAREISDQDVLAFLTEEGLLPNYAFPEAGVTLKSVIIRQKQRQDETGEKYEVTYEKYPRPASAAISELAPANFFHAEKRRLEIDQINLDLSKTEQWRFCDNCTYMEVEGITELLRECPRCKSAMWPDEGQKRTMLRMRQVLSTMTDRESRSFDESDDREPLFYQKNMFVIRDDNQIRDAYFLDNEEVPFGFEFFRKMTLREVNFGEKAGGNGTMRIAGRDWVDRPFRFCAGCGKIHKGKAKLNHSSSCRFHGKEERAVEESASFLYRELTSEAIRMLLPVSTTEVEKNLSSFVAALDLGLRRKFRGDPGHLLSTTYDEPIEGSDARKRFLVLYDGVPGGTGYLKQLMLKPESLLEVFELAHDVLTNCACQHDPNKDGCYRCLLAYHGRHDRGNTSRAAALRLLTLILENRRSLKRIDRLSTVRMNRFIESELEAKFIEALRRPRPGESEWKLDSQVVNRKQGWYLKAPGGNYLIEPQVPLGAEQNVCRMSIADFVFYPERPADGELPVAVFTDGFEYHADVDSGNLRVGSDLSQRMAISRSGRFHVWSLTWDEVDQVFNDSKEPAPFAPGKGLELLRKLAPMVAAGFDKIHGRTAFDWFLYRLGKGRTLDWSLHARAWLVAQMDSVNWTETRIEQLREELLNPHVISFAPQLPNSAVQTPFRAAIFRDGSIVGLTSLNQEQLDRRNLTGVCGTFRLFDEAATGDKPKWKADWRSFLQRFNVLQFAGPLSFVSSSGLREGVYGSMLMPEAAGAEDGRSGTPTELESLLEFADLSLHDFVRAVARGNRELPQAGFELPGKDGEIVATAELAWTDAKTAVLLEHEWDLREHFEKTGWSVHAAECADDELLKKLPGAKS